MRVSYPRLVVCFAFRLLSFIFRRPMSDTLYAPWRLDYIKTVSDGPQGCFLCDASKNPAADESNLVLARSPLCLMMLNKYPYVNGHLLVAPYRHAPTPVECTPEERAQMMEL